MLARFFLVSLLWSTATTPERAETPPSSPSSEQGFSPILDRMTDQATFIVQVKVLAITGGGGNDLKAIIEDDDVQHIARASIREVLKGKVEAYSELSFFWHEATPIRKDGEYLLFLVGGGDYWDANRKDHPLFRPIDPLLGIVPYSSLLVHCVKDRLRLPD